MAMAELEQVEPLSVDDINHYLQCAEEYAPTHWILKMLEDLRDDHPCRGDEWSFRKRIFDKKEQFEKFYGGEDSPFKFAYDHQPGKTSHADWDDCYVGITLLENPYNDFKDAVQILYKRWAGEIYDLPSARLMFDDKSKIVFFRVGSYKTRGRGIWIT